MDFQILRMDKWNMDIQILYKLKNKTILITGATGLIGSNLVKYLLSLNEQLDLNVRVLALIRSKEKAQNVFAELLENVNLEVILLGGVEQLPNIEEDIDYIIHGANPTSSHFFIERPVETITMAVYGTNRILQLAKEKQVEEFVFLSTMETYGVTQKGQKIAEADSGRFNTTEVRNCYPLSKQACESLCCAYYKEHGIRAKIARLTQTFGPGVEYTDGRVFAEFARCAIEHRNIVLKTKGETERCYLYTGDAVKAIITILINGMPGQAYTVANEDTYCSIYEMAKLIADDYGIDVEIQEQDVSKQGYANTLYMDLDTSKLQALGWRPTVGLKEMYSRMIESMR